MLQRKPSGRAQCLEPGQVQWTIESNFHHNIHSSVSFYGSCMESKLPERKTPPKKERREGRSTSTSSSINRKTASQFLISAQRPIIPGLSPAVARPTSLEMTSGKARRTCDNFRKRMTASRCFNLQSVQLTAKSRSGVSRINSTPRALASDSGRSHWIVPTSISRKSQEGRTRESLVLSKSSQDAYR